MFVHWNTSSPGDSPTIFDLNCRHSGVFMERSINMYEYGLRNTTCLYISTNADDFLAPNNCRAKHCICAMSLWRNSMKWEVLSDIFLECLPDRNKFWVTSIVDMLLCLPLINASTTISFLVASIKQSSSMNNIPLLSKGSLLSKGFIMLGLINNLFDISGWFCNGWWGIPHISIFLKRWWYFLINWCTSSDLPLFE